MSSVNVIHHSVLCLNIEHVTPVTDKAELVLENDSPLGTRVL